MDWSKGYTSEYYITLIDKETWRDTERFEISGGQIKRELSGLRESATLNSAIQLQGTENWVRVWMDTEQAGDVAHIPLFTGLATSPTKKYSGDYEAHSFDCYSVLKPASDIYLLRGWYAPSGVQGGSVIKDLLSVIPAPVNIAENSPRLSGYIIAENNETRLTMVEKILSAMDWRMKIDGSGAVSVEPKSDEVVSSFDPIDNDLIETEVSIDYDLFDCPNVFMAIEDDLTAIAKDDSDESELSIRNRGREVWAQESSCNLASNETIEQYAYRMLKELQKVSMTANYTRRYLSNVYPSDFIRLHYPAQGLDGNFMVKSQNITLGYSAQTVEDVIK